MNAVSSSSRATVKGKIVVPAPMSTQNKLLDLAMQRAVDGKDGLAASLTEVCLSPGANLNANELTIVYDIIRNLVHKVEAKIRRYIAEYLANRDDVPKDLIEFLANDEISVAYPILSTSNILLDEDLVEIISSASKRHLLAIAIRSSLTEEVSDALISTGDEDVITTLLYNNAAHINLSTLRDLVEMSEACAGYQEPLLHRHDVTRDMAAQMYGWVGDALKKYIVGHFNIDPNDIDRAASNAVVKGIVKDSPAVESKKKRPQLPEIEVQMLLALNNNDMRQYEALFRQASGLDIATLSRVLYDSKPESLAVAARACNFSLELFAASLTHLHGGEDKTAFQATKKFAQTVDYFKKLDAGAASNIIQDWRKRGGGMSWN